MKDIDLHIVVLAHLQQVFAGHLGIWLPIIPPIIATFLLSRFNSFYVRVSTIPAI